MIKLPEPFIQYEGCKPMFTEAQLKQAVYGFGEQLAEHFAATPGREMFCGEIEDEIRALIKEIPE